MSDYNPEYDPAYVEAKSVWLSEINNSISLRIQAAAFRAGWIASRKARICPSGDPNCPCPDGDACHYKDLPGSPAWPLPKLDIHPDTDGRFDRA